MKLNLKSRKTKHVNLVSDYIIDIQKRLTKEEKSL